MNFTETKKIEVTNRQGALRGGRITEITTTYKKLKQALGSNALRWSRAEAEKVTATWILECGDKVAGIWDYKEDFVCHAPNHVNRKLTFSIGGHPELARQIKKELESILGGE